MVTRRRRRFTRRRRRTKYTWLPPIGEAGGQGTGLPPRINDDVGFDFVINATADPNFQETSVAIAPLVFDAPYETSSVLGTAGVASDTPLGWFLNNEYILRRIVGNVFLTIDSRQTAVEAPSAALVACGFFVGRADDTRADVDQPIGSSEGLLDAVASSKGAIFNYSPLSPTTAREPWIWRRTWILSPWGSGIRNGSNQPLAPSGANNLATLVDGGGGYFPPTNVHYPDDKTNHYIDAKTARRVRQDERLWFVVAARAWGLHQGITNSDDLLLKGHCDLRFLGAARKARQRGTF